MDFLRLLADMRHPILDVLFQSATYIAQETVVVLIICWLYWCRDKKLAYTLGFTYFLSGLLIQGLKITFRIPRPWVLDPDFKAVESALPGATGYSFPSGHTQSGTALFSTLGFHVRKSHWKSICFFLLFFIGFSRMYLGVHTPKDVLVSMGLTLAVSACVYYLLASHLDQIHKTKSFACILLFFCVLLFAYTGFLSHSGTVDPEMAADAFKAGGAGLGFAAGYYIEKTQIRFSLPHTAKEKVLRFTAGLCSVVLLMLIFEATLKKFPAGAVISYFLLILWIVAGYPAIFSHTSDKYKK